MSALECVVSQDTGEGNLGLKPDQTAGRSVLPPISSGLNVDEKLQLSNKNFKESIDDFFRHKDITPLSQLTTTPPFPTPHVLAQFAYKAYTDYKKRETDAQYETRLDLPDGWKLLTTASNIRKNNGYFGAAYWHPEHQQVVIAHRGLVVTNLGALWTDVHGVLHNQYVPQMESAITFAHKVVEGLRDISRKNGVSFQLFYTGHSLGGWLAQITTFTTKYLEIEGNVFLKSNNDKDCYHPHTVVFDSPGCKDMLSKMVDEFDVRLDGRSIDFEQLDITSYLSAPNRINTCNSHLGTVYRIFVDVADTGSLRKPTALYNLQTHSIDKIMEAFDLITGQVHKDEEGLPKVQVVIDWPITAGLKRSEQYKGFFKWAEHLNNYHSGIKREVLQLEGYHPIVYQTETYDKRVISLRVFSQQEQQFLQNYRRLRQLPEFFEPKEIFSSMRNDQAQKKAENILQNFEIVNQTIRCRDVNTLQDLIPYVKRLLHLFPQIKERTKIALSSHEAVHNFYQLQTRRYLQQIKQSPLDFKPDAISLSEILRRDQDQVILLQIIDGDEWTGLSMVYQLLQKNNCLCEGQYIILTLEYFLTVSQLMDLSTLMLSIETPYLLLIACENNQLLNDKEEEILRTLFNTIKQKPNIKSFLITPSRDNSTTFLEKIGCETFGNGFVTRNKQLTLSDVTTSSQEKLLEKSVSFQGSKISLNKLVPTNSTLANFLPLDALLEGKQLAICEPRPTSNKYSESYYIGRTLRHQKTIKQDIFNDKDVKERQVFLATAEQDFKQLCQLYPNRNVHWLEKDKSGKLVWQQSQGSLKTLRRYIDSDSSHRYSADDLDKLLEQAQHQRVMLISDTAGMGKSTVLTHISKQIKQKFPSKLVVRIDLNDHTDTLKALEQKHAIKENAIEFVSEKLLKLKPGLELELFKQCCEQKQKIRIVIMLDGFDEISPFYKQTLIDLLQALRQTAVEQLWVTTRPHLRQELEDELQQLSYTLEAFSEENQVEFLRKLWFLNGCFTELENKTEEEDESRTKLEICSEELFQAGSDKSRDISGIPLQTPKLAKIFDGENESLSQSIEPVHCLPTNQTLLGLYEGFVAEKYELYLENKTGNRIISNAAKIKQQHILECAREDHQLLALKMLFEEEQLTQLQIENHFTLSAEYLTKIGIAKECGEGNLQFIDCSFTDYFVADFLVDQLTSGTQYSQNVQDFLLTNIFLEPRYQMIRYFIDGLLSKSKPTKEILKQYGNRMEEKRKCIEQTFFQAAYEDNANIIGFYLESLEVGEHRDYINELLLAQDKEGQTAWHLAAFCGNIKVLEKLWDWAVNKLATNVLKDKLLLAKDCNENTAWNVAAKNDNTEVLQKIWELAKKELTKEEIKNEFLLATDKWRSTVWHMTATKGHLDVFQKIWEWTKENLTNEEIKCALLLAKDYFGNTPWHVAAERGNLAVTEKLREWTEEILTKEEIKNELLLAKYPLEKTVWYVAAGCGNVEVIEKLREWAEEIVTKEEIKNELLLAKYPLEKTVWHFAAERGNLAVIEKLWEWAEEILTKEEIKNELLLAKDFSEKTVWYVSAGCGNVEVIEKLREWAEEILTKEEIKNELLLSKDYKKNTVWHVAAEWGNVEVIEKLREWAEEILTKEEKMYALLFAKDKYGNTPWHFAVERGNLALIEKLREWAEEIPTKEEKKYALLFAKDKYGNTPWHFAVQRGNLAVTEKLREWAEEILTKEEKKYALLFAKDKYGNTPWHFAVQRGNLAVIEKLREWAEEILTKEEIKNELLLSKDYKKRTVWHVAAGWGNVEVIQKLWEWAEEILTKEEIKNELLLAKNSSEKTVWHVAAGWGKLEVIEKLREWAEEILTKEEIKNELLLSKDYKIKTVWQVAVEQGNLAVIQKLWEWAEEILTKEEKKYALLLAKDYSGNTPWHIAVELGNLAVIGKLREWDEETLTKEEIKDKLLLTKGRMGKTDRQMATKDSKLSSLHDTWNVANPGGLNKNVFLSKDVSEQKVLHLASKRDRTEVLEEVWEQCKEHKIPVD